MYTYRRERAFGFRRRTVFRDSSMCCRYYVESSERTREIVEQMPPSLRSRWKSHRCIIPATYYYEWEHLKDMRTGKEKNGDKYILQTKDKEMTYLCGLYRIIGELPYFVILTRQPGESIRFIHDRMPLILSEEYIDDWIKPDSVLEDMIGNAITDPFFEKYKDGIEPVEQLSFL